MFAYFFLHDSRSFVICTLVICACLGLVRANPTRHRSCKHPIVRREWRNLYKNEQLDYLNAVKCLLKKPPITPRSVAPGVGSRYYDFIATHIIQTFSIHFVGHFLPWHRHFTAVYEDALRNEFNYKGVQPQVSSNTAMLAPTNQLISQILELESDVPPLGQFTKSPVWDPVYGFGGNGPFKDVPANNTFPPVPGRTGGGCVQDGPFKSMVVRMGPADNLTGNPRCLSRDFSPYFAGRYLGANVTKHTLEQPDFGYFDQVVEGGPSFETSGVHGGGHYSVGGTLGEMGDLYNSPADPVVYMHHANLDRVWWSWQSKDLDVRMTDISGPINLMDYTNVKGGNVTLSFPLSLGMNAKNVTIKDVMDIKSEVLCYTYDHLYEF